jgi:hypothetical protein
LSNLRTSVQRSAANGDRLVWYPML